MRQLASDSHVRVALLTLACFLLASTGWIIWLYHLTELSSPLSVDVLTMGVGYLMQAAGIGISLYLARTQNLLRQQRVLSLATVGFVACLVPAILSADLAPVLAFGYLANLLCGTVQGYYLHLLARDVDERHRGIVFGGAYAVSTGCSWLLSIAMRGSLTRGIPGIVTCVVLAVPAIAFIRTFPSPTDDHTAVKPVVGSFASDSSLLLACAVVTLMSLTKGAGFSFPSVDLLEGVSLELSRLLYGVGLLVAGFASDRNRRIGALCCAGALVTPFLMLALSGAAAPATFMWALGYLLNGFFSVFRVVLLADLAVARNKPYLAGLGLLSGRVGDALGTIVAVSLSSSPLVLITVVSALFALTLMLFFVLYQRLYLPVVEPKPTEREIFELFAARHDLSVREREVLRLVLAERTNAEIASELFVSEATVKYHVRNLLKKTGCKNRVEILALYGGAGQEE